MIWGDGTQTRSYTYIEDCVKGIDMIVHCDELIATPINLGSSELISVDGLVSLAELPRRLGCECCRQERNYAAVHGNQQ